MTLEKAIVAVRSATQTVLHPWTQPNLVSAKIPRGFSPELLEASMAGSVLLLGVVAVLWAQFSGALARLRWAIPVAPLRITLAVWVVFHALVGLVFPLKPVLPFRELSN